jgi:D-alanyl-D-alanine carboxypeptidase/D-alanyl-D-alanine-endopeptidase (penicillin-binding protein 4)
MPLFASSLRRLRQVVGVALAAAAVVVFANPASPWPAEVDAALARAKLPREALSVYVADAQDARANARLAYRAQEPVNPASVMKLVTTYAALDLLGPAYTWSTPVYIDGVVQGGSLKGNVYIQGQGDPKLVLERPLAVAAAPAGAGCPGHRGRYRAGPQCVHRACTRPRTL